MLSADFNSVDSLACVQQSFYITAAFVKFFFYATVVLDVGTSVIIFGETVK